jgi:hypothetical protein
MDHHYFLETAFRSFSKKEHEKFKKFLQSPYFPKKHSSSKRLFYFYIEFYKRIREIKRIRKTTNNKNLILVNMREEINYEVIYKNMVGKNYSKQRINELIKIKSDLFVKYLEFLAFEYFGNEKWLFIISLLEHLLSKKLNDIFEHVCNGKKFNKVAMKISVEKTSYFYWKLFQIANIYRESNKIPLKKDFDSNIDYDLEKEILKGFFKSELFNILKRQIKNTSKSRR